MYPRPGRINVPPATDSHRPTVGEPVPSERLFDYSPRCGPREIENLRRSVVMLSPGHSAGAVSRDHALRLFEEIAGLQQETARYRDAVAELRRVLVALDVQGDDGRCRTRPRAVQFPNQSPCIWRVCASFLLASLTVLVFVVSTLRHRHLGSSSPPLLGLDASPGAAEDGQACPDLRQAPSGPRHADPQRAKG
jgi:hypothetical protein